MGGQEAAAEGQLIVGRLSFSMVCCPWISGVKDVMSPLKLERGRVELCVEAYCSVAV